MAITTAEPESADDCYPGSGPDPMIYKPLDNELPPISGTQREHIAPVAAKSNVWDPCLSMAEACSEAQDGLSRFGSTNGSAYL